MKNSKRMLSIILAMLLVACVFVFMTACGGDETPDSTPDSNVESTPESTPDSTPESTPDSTPESTPSVDSQPDSTKDSLPSLDSTPDSTPSSKPDSTPESTPVSTPESTPASQPEKASYTIEIVSKSGRKMADVDVFIYNTDGYIVAKGTTDENGIVVLKAKAGEYYEVEIDGLPDGYVYEDFYEMDATGKKIEVNTQVIENEENSFAGIKYELGDVIHDFTFTTMDGNSIKLSQLFADGKKAVVLNFWYTTCTYCIEEFPYIQGAYEKYGDQIEVIGVNAYPTDNETKINQFLADFASGYYTGEPCELTFPMVIDEVGLQDAFGFTVNPCTVIIDKYGVISLVQVGGVMGQRYFENAFEHYVTEDYKQELYSSIYDLSPRMKPNVTMPSSDEIKDAFANGDITVTFKPETEGDDAEYSWPFVITEKNGVTCIKSTNYDIDNSFAIMYAEVYLEANQAVMFDYYASTQRLYDVLYVLVDDKDIYSISGMPLQEDDGTLLEDPWKTCCTWVAEKSGTYEIAFCYIKDSSEKAGEDTVYLKNLRVVDSEDIDVETYIPRYAATGLNKQNSYDNYATIVYNENDGYYHVNDENGPLLLAGLLGVNTPFTDKLAEDKRLTVTDKITEDGTFKVDGVERYNQLIMYCNYASNSKIYGYCPVTEELRGYLEAYVKQVDFITNENTWLELCSYYSAYGNNGKQLADPIKGLATFSAYDAILTEDGEAGFKNVVTYEKIIMPRGLLYKFVPEKSGVYRITSKSNQEVDGWVFIGNVDTWINENGGDRILYTDSFLGERYCSELLVDKDGDGVYEHDRTNVSMINYFEAGVEYYIDIAYYDVYGTGTFTFDLKYVGESFGRFEEASPGVFTYIEGMGDIIAGGINVALCTDEEDPRFGYYCHLLPNGTLGSILYADFYYTTNIFASQSIKTLVEIGGFNMEMTATDREAYVYYKNYYLEGGINALKEKWGDEFDANWEIYQMADIIKGIYHGTGPDYTEAMQAYIDKMLDERDEDGNLIYPERQGCVPVDKELAVMLQAVMDKFSFSDVEHSWTKLCYYYKDLSEPLTVDEKKAELESMLQIPVENPELQAEIQLIAEALEASLEGKSVDFVIRSLIDQAMTDIYQLILADKAE